MPIAISITSGIALITDLKKRKIYNWLTMSSLGCALLWSASTGNLSDALLGSLAAFMLYFGLYVSGVLGAGDVKILMALGAWTGPIGGLQIGIYAILFGGVVAALALAREDKLLPLLRRIVLQWVNFFKTRRIQSIALSGLQLNRSHHIPFALPIFAAVIAYLYFGKAHL